MTRRKPRTMTIRRGGTFTLAAPTDATRLLIGGQGKLVTANVADGEAKLSATQTGAMPPGEYRSEWSVDQDGDVVLQDGPRMIVRQSLAKDGDAAATLSWDETVLNAARTALAAAAGSGDISFSAEGQTYSFEGRNDLLAFVSRLELRVARRKGTLKRSRRITL